MHIYAEGGNMENTGSNCIDNSILLLLAFSVPVSFSIISASLLH